jgi:hypothetical protein
VNNLPNLWNGSAIGASTGPVFFMTWRGLPRSPRTSKGRISWLRCCWKICAVIGSLSLHGGCWNCFYTGGSRAERLVYRALTNGLTETRGDALDTLLSQKPETATSWMG